MLLVNIQNNCIFEWSSLPASWIRCSTWLLFSSCLCCCGTLPKIHFAWVTVFLFERVWRCFCAKEFPAIITWDIERFNIAALAKCYDGTVQLINLSSNIQRREMAAKQHPAWPAPCVEVGPSCVSGKFYPTLAKLWVCSTSSVWQTSPKTSSDILQCSFVFPGGGEVTVCRPVSKLDQSFLRFRKQQRLKHYCL